MIHAPSYISDKLNKHIQTRANNADSSTRLWISRPTTALANTEFLEHQTVGVGAVTDVSIAACHPLIQSSNTQIYLGYISDGTARVLTSKHMANMNAHAWVDTGFEEAATSISVAYDGTMPKSVNGDVEFVTELYPWVFWVQDSVLYGRKLYSVEEPTILAETNCSDVSAIRAMRSSVGGFDFGFVVFFILNGKLFYRQLIDGEWLDAELVAFGPSDVTWKEVAAFRTWDYRVGVQVKAEDGSVYELFTQFMGIGKQNVEHIEVNADANLTLAGIEERTPATVEHAVMVNRAESGAPYDGLYSTLPPKIIDAYNIDDGHGNWGKTLIVVFDVHLRPDEIARNFSSFILTDKSGAPISPSSATLHIEDAKTVELTFEDFNAAAGTCRIMYVPGDAVTLADTLMELTEFEFVPTNLNPSHISVPKAVSVWNF